MAKQKPLHEIIMERLDPEMRMHFTYHGLFLNQVDPNDPDAVSAYLTKTYMNNQTLEDFAISQIVTSISDAHKKYAVKPKTDAVKPAKPKQQPAAPAVASSDF
jgi:hypothetical protein